jgi:hypothetical protein
MNNMQFTVYDEEVERQVKEIRKLVRLSMDGSVSESMASLGYKLNWGVSIPRIKELASRFGKDARLAMRLWNIGHRETMIIATLLMPENGCPESVAQAWAEDINNSELAEQCCRNLFVRLSYADKLAELCYNKPDSPHTKEVAYRLASKFIMKGSSCGNDFSESLINNVKTDVQNKKLSDPIAQYLKQYAKHISKADAEKALESLQDVNPWVFEEVSTFINYSC